MIETVFMCRRCRRSSSWKYSWRRKKKKKKIKSRREKIYFHFTRFFSFIFYLLPPNPLRSSIFLIIFVVDGKTFNLKASLLHPSYVYGFFILTSLFFFSQHRSKISYYLSDFSFPFFPFRRLKVN